MRNPCIILAAGLAPIACMTSPYNGQDYNPDGTAFQGFAQNPGATVVIEGYDKARSRWVELERTTSSTSPVDLGQYDGYYWNLESPLSTPGGPSVYCLMDASCDAPGDIQLQAREIGSDLSHLYTFDDSGECVNSQVNQGKTYIEAGLECKSEDMPVVTLVVDPADGPHQLCPANSGELTRLWQHIDSSLFSMPRVTVGRFADDPYALAVEDDTYLLRKYDGSTGTLTWSESIQADVNDISANSSGGVVEVDWIESASYSRVNAFDSSGATEWGASVVELDPVELKAVDRSMANYVLSAGWKRPPGAETSLWVGLHGNDSSLLWSVTEQPPAGGSENAVDAVFTQGNLPVVLSNRYPADAQEQSLLVRTYDLLGNPQWSWRPDEDLVRGGTLAMGPDGGIYVAGARATLDRAGRLYKLTSDGSLAWSLDLEDDALPMGIAVDKDGNLTVGVDVFGGSPSLRRYDRHGGHIRTAPLNGRPRSLAVDSACHVYVSGVASGDAWVAKYE